MIRTLRAYFFSRLLREKLLLAALILIGALFWLSSFSGHVSHFLRREHQATLTLADQKQWLAHRVIIEDSARKAASIFDPARTLDSTQLNAAVNSLADEAGLHTTASSGAQDVSNGQFAVHSLQFSITRTDWSTLSAFYVALQHRSPYIGIEEFQLAADRAKPDLLNANLKISSVEIVHDAP